MNRREWLITSLAWSFAGSALGILGWIFGDVWLAAGRFSSAHWYGLAAVDDLDGDRTIPFPAQQVALIRREGRVAALNLECTHLGCLVNVMDQGFYCPCHGSEFGPLGEVYSGPARTPLQWHAIRFDQGQIFIRAGEKLDQPQWLTLPSATPAEKV
jgi:nitrite reductase/ring-hydroxylating ferredoxin subunit